MFSRISGESSSSSLLPAVTSSYPETCFLKCQTAPSTIPTKGRAFYLCIMQDLCTDGCTQTSCTYPQRRALAAGIKFILTFQRSSSSDKALGWRQWPRNSKNSCWRTKKKSNELQNSTGQPGCEGEEGFHESNTTKHHRGKISQTFLKDCYSGCRVLWFLLFWSGGRWGPNILINTRWL